MIEKILSRILLESSSCKAYKLFSPSKEDVAELNAYKKCYEIVQEVAKEYGKDTNVRSNGWIPCSERLPEFNQEVLITAEDSSVYQGVMANGGFMIWEDGWIDTKRTLAWQPLPAPYQKAPSRCDTCTHNVAEVPPICYMCSKGIEDNYVAKEGE